MAETRIETYIPLYRKYRPQAFADVVGQEAIVQTLGNAITLNKVAHAYLFCGPRGTGKTSTARIFAKSLNCEQGPTVTPCLQCASCQGIATGNALDVIEFDAASNNGVDDARELIENAQYAALSGRFKIYIIDEVHMLSTQAFNALLKTLEEPPANVIFIFATTEAHKVLPTIISRCQRFDFNRITTRNIVSRLQWIAEQEDIAIDDEAVMMIARHARGGLRDAVGLLDQVAVLSRSQPGMVIGRKDVSLFIGTLEEDTLLSISAAIAERRAADLLNLLNELVNRGIEPIQLLKDLTLHFRNLMLVQAAGPGTNPDLLALPQDYFEQLAKQAALFPEPEELPQIIGRMSAIERNIRQGTQPQLWLEVGLIELAYRHDINRVTDLAERVARLESQLAGGPSAAPHAGVKPAPKDYPAASRPKPPISNPEPVRELSQPAAAPVEMPVEPPTVPAAQPLPAAAPPAGKPAPLSNMKVAFDSICAAVASIPTRALLQQQAFPISHNGNVFTIGCASEPTLNLLKKPDKFIHLQKAADQYFGKPVKIELLLEKKPEGHASISAAAGPLPAAAPAEAEISTLPPAAETAVAVLPDPAPALENAFRETPSFDPIPESSAESPTAPVSDPDLADAKKHAVELLHGKVLE